LTIDTCVLRDGSGKGEAEFFESSLTLLREFETNTRLFAAIDQQGFVTHEYSENINATMFAAEWLKKFSGRIKKVTTCPLPQSLRAKLDELHFSTKDRRFVQVALATGSKIIVTRDPDYSYKVTRELRKQCEIRVFTAEEAIDFVRKLTSEAASAPNAVPIEPPPDP